METKHAFTYTVYTHNLWDSSRSFASDIKLDDFGKGVWSEILKATKVVYVNPRGTSIVLRDKNGTK